MLGQRTRLKRHTRPILDVDVADITFEEELTGVLEDHDLTGSAGDSDPGRNPEPPSDGETPATSPTPTVRADDGALRLSWTATPNRDPVTYKIYTSATTGFTPDDATNLHGTTQATGYFADGLTNGVLRYVKIVASDADGEGPIGAQASGTPTAGFGSGTQPATPNTPVVTPGVRSLFVRWTGLVHPDIIKYEVHLSTTTGFTPDANTKCGDMVGELFHIWSLPPQGNTTLLTFDQLYYVKIKAVSGAFSSVSAQASGTVIRAGTPYLEVGSVTADIIAANAVTAGKLEATLVLASTIIAGIVAGARTEISATAIRAHRASGAGTETFYLDCTTGNTFWYKSGTGSDRIRILANATDLEFIKADGIRRGAILFQSTDQLNILGGDTVNRSRVDVKADRVTFRLKGTDADGTNGTVVDLLHNAASPSLTGLQLTPDLITARKLVQGGEYSLTYPAASQVSNPFNGTFSFPAGPRVVAGPRGTGAPSNKTLHVVSAISSTGFTITGYTIDASNPGSGATANGSWTATAATA